MTKEDREQVNAIIEDLREIEKQICKLYHKEEPKNYSVDRDLKEIIQGRNIVDFGSARNSLGEAVNRLENTICREITE